MGRGRDAGDLLTLGRLEVAGPCTSGSPSVGCRSSEPASSSLNKSVNRSRSTPSDFRHAGGTSRAPAARSSSTVIKCRSSTDLLQEYCLRGLHLDEQRQHIQDIEQFPWFPSSAWAPTFSKLRFPCAWLRCRTRFKQAVGPRGKSILPLGAAPQSDAAIALTVLLRFVVVRE